MTILLFGQIVEYEYYDNTTQRANEYEYEEEYDERYGPAERDPGYSLHSQVFHDFIGGKKVFLSTNTKNDNSIRIYQRKGRKESQGILER